KAQTLAPENADIAFLQGVIAEQSGEPDEAVGLYEKAISLDSTHAQAQFALIEQLQRRAGLGEAPDLFPRWQAILSARPGNVKAALELLRSAAERGDAAGLRRMLDTLKERVHTWPPEALALVKELETGASGSAAAAGNTARRLGNLLSNTPAYQRDYAAIRGEDHYRVRPFPRFLRLPPATAGAAPPDTALTFAAGTAPRGLPSRVLWLRGELLAPAAPARRGGTRQEAAAAGAERPPTDKDTPATQSPSPPGAPQPGSAAAPGDGQAAGAGARTLLVTMVGKQMWTDAEEATPIPIPAAPSRDTGACFLDWNTDFLPDLALLTAAGLRLLEQKPAGKWMDVTAAARFSLPAPAAGEWTGAWALDVESDGDLDLVLGAPAGPPVVLRNNGDGAWSPASHFPAVNGLSTFVWADLDGDNDPDGAALDGSGRLVLLQNERSGAYLPVALPAPGAGARFATLAVVDLDRDGTLDLAAAATDGNIYRVSGGAEAAWKSSPLVAWEPGAGDPTVRLFAADLDNNGAVDLVASGKKGSRAWLAAADGT
ncbi:MAG: hypothetical protein FJX77_16630, partial [Armatimonadetes bacterium]|nr:hypothetical protein [Armatimonadota bacterium]